MKAKPNPVYFKCPADLRRWFSAQHRSGVELWVGFYKKATGKPTVTYHEALDEALAVGWIDGVRKRIDASRYAQRFTPRRARSVWSQVNVARVNELRAAGRMKAAGLRAFEARDEALTRRYSYERARCAFPPALARVFKSDPAAWTFFQAQPPGYRRTATWWVVSAKQEETRQRRLRLLAGACAAGRRLGPLSGGPAEHGV